MKRAAFWSIVIVISAAAGWFFHAWHDGKFRHHFTKSIASPSDGRTSPFYGKASVAKHIYAEKPSQFKEWGETAVDIGNYDKEYFSRYRRGTIAISESTTVYLDFIQDEVNFPSFYEIIDAKTGKLLGKYPVYDNESADWYFTGNGVAYLNQKHMQLCGPTFTRKFVLRDNKLLEQRQPFIYIGAESKVEESTPLYESADGKIVVATLAKGSTATVVGLQPGSTELLNMALLVKTPFGLTGWHLPRGNQSDGTLDIYQCN